MIRPSLRQLGFLAALADEEHFGRAAEKCHITQSALSTAIKELEDLLGVRLAERTKRSVRMTPIGIKLAERAKRLLRDVEDFVDFAARTKEPLSGDLRLGVIPTVGPFLLPRLIKGLRRRYPKLRLLLREEPTDQLLHLLREGTLDVLLMAFPYPTDDIVQEPLFNDGYQLACPIDHPLARRRQIRRHDLVDLHLMLLERQHCLHRHALSGVIDGNLQRDAELEATSLATLVAMVAEGLGVTLLPQLAIDAGITDRYDIALIPISHVCPRQIGLAWRRTSWRGEELKTLGQMMRKAAKRPA